MSGPSPADPGRRRPRSPLAWLLLLPVRLWRMTAPMRAPRCRFYPSCSSYAVQAVSTHGALRGGVLAARRVGRCHPWNPGGVDHVPEPGQHEAWRHRHGRPSSTTE